MPVFVTGALTWMQFVDQSGKLLTFDGILHLGEVPLSQINPGFHNAGQMAGSMYGISVGECFANVNIVDRGPHGGGRVTVWADMSLMISLMAIRVQRDTTTRS